MVKQDILIELLQSDSNRAMPLIYDQYNQALYGVVLRIVNDEHQAQDVLQDVFVKIWQNRYSYDAKKGRLFTWMMQITRNMSINAVQSKANKNQQKIQKIDNNVYHIKSKLGVKEETLDCVDILNKLEDKYRKIIELAYFHGYTQKEISEKLSMPLGSVKSAIKIGLRKLRSVYEGNVVLTAGYSVVVLLLKYFVVT